MTSRNVRRAYLDTNVLIEYAWEKLARGPPKGRSQAHRVMERGMEGEFEMTISTFCTMELYEHFRDWFLLQRVISSGFGYREFRRERKRHRLSRGEVRFLEGIVSDFRDHPDIFFVEFERVPRRFFSRVGILQRNGIDGIDAFHILSALDVEATHFVTKDGEVRARFDAATRREVEAPPMVMTGVQGFLRGL